MTVSAAGGLIPRPPALVLRRTKMSCLDTACKRPIRKHRKERELLLHCQSASISCRSSNLEDPSRCKYLCFRNVMHPSIRSIMRVIWNKKRVVTGQLGRVPNETGTTIGHLLGSWSREEASSPRTQTRRDVDDTGESWLRIL